MKAFRNDRPNNIAWAINSFKPFKSPGPDGISPAHLQHAGKTAINWLQSIFTGIFRTGQIPEPWKYSKVVFIPKAGKASHITAKDFRPISLTSFLLKTFERILSLHLRAIIPCDLISNSQHAYRKDIEGAFNNVFPDAITEALTDLGIEGRLVGLINQLLTSRAVTSTLGSSTLTRDEWTSATPGQEGALFFYTDGSKLNNQAPYSDSQAAIKSIAATTTKSTSVSICRRSLHEMAEHFDIQLIWVPGHQDIPGNCIADELARKGTTDILLPDKEDISMPLATCKLMLQNLSNHNRSVRWQNSLVGRVARQTWPHIDKARSNALCNLSRGDSSLVIRSLTGHWLIGIHAQRLNSPYNDFCRSCRDEEEEESPEHFFCFCPALSSRRFRFLGKTFLDGLGDLASLSPRKIAQFVQSSNWTPF
ncbi:hypothetical protein ACLKA6_001130 [Drosophila palustris]